jgi:CDP-glucose 4,6-dehydratase
VENKSSLEIMVDNKAFGVFFHEKRVLITGHTGFKGSWLSLWLSAMGAKVTGFALDPKHSTDNFYLLNLSEKINDVRGDIRDFEKLNEVFNKEMPEIVFHLAAQPLVLESYQNPRETYETNVMGTVNLFECCRLSKSVKTIINVTSDKCYENKEWIWGYKETDPMGGYDPYSSSKGCSELVTSAYRNSFFPSNAFNMHGKSIASARAGNVIGGGDWSENRIIPDCIKAIFNSKEIEIRNPKAIRPWQHVLEPLRGYLLLAKEMYNDPVNFSSSFNFGPDSSSIVPVEKLVNMLIKYLNMGSWKFTGNEAQPHEAKLLALDISKAKYFLNWFPVLNIEQTVKYTANWYSAYHSGENMYDFGLSQIKLFIKEIDEII